MRSLVVAFLVAGALGVVEPPATARQRVARGQQPPSAASSRFTSLGPEMLAYMGFIDGEEAELKHLYEVGEVPPDDYRIQRDRLVVMREAALRVAGARGEDVVPDLYILRDSELTQVLPTGVAAVRGKRAGEMIDNVWMYHGTIRRGELFHVLERTEALGRATTP
jgi:hypothetical protein